MTGRRAVKPSSAFAESSYMSEPREHPPSPPPAPKQVLPEDATSSTLLATEKEYHELPAGLMVPERVLTEPPYTPIASKRIKAPSGLPAQTPELMQAVEDYYRGIEVIHARFAKGAENGLEGNANAGGVDEGNMKIDRDGWEVGYLDEWYAKVDGAQRGRGRGGREKRRARSESEDGGRGGSRSPGRRKRGRRGSSRSRSRSRGRSERSRSGERSRGRGSKGRKERGGRDRSSSSGSRSRSRSGSSRSGSRSSGSGRSRSRSRERSGGRSWGKSRDGSRERRRSGGEFERRGSEGRREYRRSRSPDYGRRGYGGGERNVGYQNPMLGGGDGPSGARFPGLGMGAGGGGGGGGGGADQFESFRRQMSYTYSRDGPPVARGGGMGCFRCGKPGHIARDCDDYNGRR
ncbi:hypothetical protein HDV00_004406 [Rhizophlyctis rosea]|nr:hypothetical protein HDV00_004406 [Rhizophlyctis rosea]